MRSWELSPAQKQRAILRSDSGFGGDDNVNYALRDQWHVLTKGSGGRRPGAFARQILPDDWQILRPDGRWVAPAVVPPAYLVAGRLQGQLGRSALYVSTWC